MFLNKSGNNIACLPVVDFVKSWTEKIITHLKKYTQDDDETLVVSFDLFTHINIVIE
jgi:hypothetical protein